MLHRKHPSHGPMQRPLAHQRNSNSGAKLSICLQDPAATMTTFEKPSAISAATLPEKHAFNLHFLGLDFEVEVERFLNYRARDAPLLFSSPCVNVRAPLVERRFDTLEEAANGA